ncbi:MAG: 50S ribosomal protein L11 methyltransferase [Oscillospiraceae bacterium]
MRWIEAIYKTTAEKLDDLCLTLTELGADGLVIEDESDFKRFLEENRQYWDYVDDDLLLRYRGVSRVKLYVSDDAEGKAALAKFTEGVGAEPETSVVDDADWENKWKQYYKPINIGEKLVIVPKWEETPQNGRLALRLDPGLTFGTGSHPTTRMCLELLEKSAAREKFVLDLGCGSGILGIGALVLGCAYVAGCDVDPKSPDVALENAGLNGIGEASFRLYAGDILRDASLRATLGSGYDIVLANIVADVIIPLAPLAREFMSKNGVFICSGIIEGRQDEVLSALEAAGFTVINHLCEEGWHCFSTKIV